MPRPPPISPTKPPNKATVGATISRNVCQSMLAISTSKPTRRSASQSKVRTTHSSQKFASTKQRRSAAIGRPRQVAHTFVGLLLQVLSNDAKLPLIGPEHPKD